MKAVHLAWVLACVGCGGAPFVAELAAVDDGGLVGVDGARPLVEASAPGPDGAPSHEAASVDGRPAGDAAGGDPGVDAPDAPPPSCSAPSCPSCGQGYACCTAAGACACAPTAFGACSGTAPGDAGDASPPVDAAAACASTCNGCCDAAGVCHGGNSTTTCGRGGNKCSDCSFLGATCNAGTCGFTSNDGGPNKCVASQCTAQALCQPVYQVACCKSDETCGCAVTIPTTGPCQ